MANINNPKGPLSTHWDATVPPRTRKRKGSLAKCRATNCRFLLLVALTCGFGCDNKSTSDASSSPQTPTSAAEVLPPRPIPTNTLPFAEDELNVAGAFPGPDDTRVALVSPISVIFDGPLLAGQHLAQAIRVSAGNIQISGSITLASADTLIFRPSEMWQPNTRYLVDINPELMSEDGLGVNPQVRWQFLTIADVHTTSQSIIDLCMSDLDVEMLAAVNQARSIPRICGTDPYEATGKLTWNCHLQEAALAHSQDMANNDFFEHTGSDGSDVALRISRTGYMANMAGENLAVGFQTVTAAMEELLESRGHCATIMAAEFIEFGFGAAVNTESVYQHYWTQNFARPVVR